MVGVRLRRWSGGYNTKHISFCGTYASFTMGVHYVTLPVLERGKVFRLYRYASWSNLVFAGTLFPRCFSSVSEAPCGIATLLSFTVSMAFDLILPLMLRLQILCFFILRRLIFAKHGRG